MKGGIYMRNFLTDENKKKLLVEAHKTLERKYDSEYIKKVLETHQRNVCTPWYIRLRRSSRLTNDGNLTVLFQIPSPKAYIRNGVGYFKYTGTYIVQSDGAWEYTGNAAVLYCCIENGHWNIENEFGRNGQRHWKTRSFMI